MNSSKAVLRLAPQIKLFGQSRNMTAVSGPPSYRMSFQEKVAHGIVMGISWIAFPAWVLVNIKNYRAPKSE